MSKFKRTFVRIMEDIIYWVLSAFLFVLAVGIAIGILITVVNAVVGCMLAIGCAFVGIKLAAFVDNRYIMWYRKKFPKVYRY